MNVAIVGASPRESERADCADHDRACAEPDAERPEPRATGEDCLEQVTDAELTRWIEQIADRDERALDALYTATFGQVYGLALRIVRDPSLAEEVVEDTYFQVWRLAARFNAGQGRPLTWVLSMARSRAIETVRAPVPRQST
jgi:RNA polymerase sigma-70 factor (ECF subfamily)